MAADETARRAILVLGMHRSGTSAVAAALQAMGVPLGDDLLTPAEDNPGGYFEHADAVTAHEELLARLGRGWDDVRALPAGWMELEAGKRAASAVGALVSQPFARGSLWAVKDPRLCRLLPLWSTVLRATGVEPRYLMVLRHPDEVAASLARRNDFPLEYGHLLWLMYVLEAERESRRGLRCVLTYDALLADPVRSLERVGQRLQVIWPTLPEEAGLQGLLDPARRHHQANPGDSVSDTIRAGNLALYAELATPTGVEEWPALSSHVQRLQEWRMRHAPWLDAAGTALARSRLHALESMQAQQRMSDALGRAEAISFAHLSDAEALDARLHRADEALRRAQDLVAEQQDQLRALDARARATDVALEEAKTLAVARQQELQVMDARARTADAALESAQHLAETRLAEIRSLDARARATDVALEEAKKLAMERQQELKAMDARMQMSAAALREAQALVQARQEELASVDQRLFATDSALHKATALAVAAQAEVAMLDARLRATDAALGDATAMAMERLTQLGVLQSAVEAAAGAHNATRTELEALHVRFSTERAQSAQQLGAVRTQVEELTREITEREARLQALLTSASWRITRPLRWLARHLGARGRSPS